MKKTRNKTNNREIKKIIKKNEFEKDKNNNLRFSRNFRSLREKIFDHFKTFLQIGGIPNKAEAHGIYNYAICYDRPEELKFLLENSSFSFEDYSINDLESGVASFCEMKQWILDLLIEYDKISPMFIKLLQNEKEHQKKIDELPRMYDFDEETGKFVRREHKRLKYSWALDYITKKCPLEKLLEIGINI